MAKTLGKNHKNIIAPFDADFFMCNINIFEFIERGKKKEAKTKKYYYLELPWKIPRKK